MFDNETDFRVVHNEEGRYSIWPTGRELPNGWYDSGTRGTKAECLARIDEMWTDMRSFSVSEP